MKILLISITVGALTEELGISMIAATLKKKYDVQIVSLNINNSTENVHKYVADFMPEIIGINIYNVTREKVYEVSRQIKSINSDIFVFAGGVEAFCNPKRILQEEECIDFVISGEGEQTTIELIKAIGDNMSLDDIDGLSYRSMAKYIKYILINLENY